MLKSKNFFKTIAVFAILVMIMYMFTGCQNGEKTSNKKDEKAIESSYEEPVKNLIEGLSEGNSEKFLKAFPSYISDYMKAIFTDEYLKSTLEKAKEDYGENIQMTYELKNKEEISEGELNRIKQDVKDNFDKEIEITKGYSLDVDIKTKGDKTEDTEEDTFNVYQVDGKWYILDF